MKIYIKEKDKKPIRLNIPNGLFMNRLVASIGAIAIKNQTSNIPLSSKQLYNLFRILKESKKVFGHYNLVEVESSDGEIIYIQI